MRNLTILLAAALLAFAIMSRHSPRYTSIGDTVMVLDTKTGNILLPNGKAYLLEDTTYRVREGQ